MSARHAKGRARTSWCRRAQRGGAAELTRILGGFVLALAAVLAGCGAPGPAPALHAGEAHGITCSGPERTWSLCGARAAAICGERGYDVVAAGGGTAAMIETLNPSAGVDGPLDERSLLIRCR